ncbi:uncharacterized protein LOC111083379 [Limulus polyphemus]|uniref:Uncharacterized protein LOC111083379 n=1 Tax=Limulus polyphemus TaxID=6850 RepID=A0ABM1RW26_LIMPO|nr:uncharacterized protein LOC111083379 [Limulus polyphemus]
MFNTTKIPRRHTFLYKEHIMKITIILLSLVLIKSGTTQTNMPNQTMERDYFGEICHLMTNENNTVVEKRNECLEMIRTFQPNNDWITCRKTTGAEDKADNDLWKEICKVPPEGVGEMMYVCLRKDSKERKQKSKWIEMPEEKRKIKECFQEAYRVLMEPKTP